MHTYLFYCKRSFFFSKYAVITTILVLTYNETPCQCLDKKDVIAILASTEKDKSLSNPEKLKILYALKKRSDSCKTTADSVYISILQNICVYELQMKNYSTTLSYALQALELNNPRKKNFSKNLLVKNYSILAHYYDQALLFSKALAYYDSTIAGAANFSVGSDYMLDARLFKAYIYFRIGDFQKGVEESTIGAGLCLAKKDSITYLRFLNQRAQSLFYQDNLKQASYDIDAAIEMAKKFQQPFQLATAYKTKALVAAKKQDFSNAEFFFTRGIEERMLTKRYDIVATDYSDFGNFYRDSARLYDKAKSCYFKAILYALRTADSTNLGMININLSKTFFYEHDYKTAEYYYLKQMNFFRLPTDNFLTNPPAKAISLIGNKHIIIALLQDKTELLLNEYKINGLRQYLSATIATARLTDSVITQTQQEQTAEQSKLFWRNKTREFYRNSIEACYLKKEPGLAFFFFEKSRAALLNEQLHQLDAANHLPLQEVEKQEKFQIDIIEQEQKLSLLPPLSTDFAAQQIKLLQAKENFENYIKSIEQKYPAYYQYKYALQIPSLQNLQHHLTKNNQSFVHYFIDDTVTYILAITGTDTKFIRLSHTEFDKETLSQFLQFCANKQKLNNHYKAFAFLSNSIYKKIFQLLRLPKGRVIICIDNIVIPFEALCKDIQGETFLLNDYSFSYVYSAGFMIKQFRSAAAKVNFAGFAPVQFEKHLGVADLTNAAKALHATASFYKNDKLLVHQNATRHNFFKYASSASVVSIFSHAKADTTDNEPLFFMQDSVIHLSELRLLNNPSTKIVLLSACQTNVGRAATGEGIYSLARGFATAGIPSVAATLWKADEQTIYAISEKFNEYLAEGMHKDEALQKAKLYFTQYNNNNGKILPYYWANMILIGNTEAIKLNSPGTNYWWWILVSFAMLLSLFFITRINRHKKSRPLNLPALII